MKRFFIAAAFIAALCSCDSHQPGVYLSLSGLDADDSVMIYKQELTGMNLGAGIMAIPSGELFVPTESESVAMYQLYKKPQVFPDGSMEAMSMTPLSLPVVPGIAITVEGTFSDYTVKASSAFYNELGKIDSHVKPLRKEAMAAAMASRDRTRPKNERDSLSKVAEDCVNRVFEFVNTYVEENPSSDAALYAFYCHGNKDRDYACLDRFTEDVRKGLFAPLYDRLVEGRESMLRKIEAQKSVADGMMAPEFTLKDINGKDVSLSSFRGKYVVLDFWGSWCGWCIKGVPEMKKMYSKYSNRIEVIGIACRDTEEAWRSCVEENELPWTNLINSDGENSVPERYAVSGYPTKIIIDTEGRILKTVVGESPEFYSYIDSIMGK